VAVRVGNRLKSIAVGRWRQPFHFRTSSAWASLLNREGLHVAVQRLGEGTPFANVLLRGVRSADSSALLEPADTDNRDAERIRHRLEFPAEPERARDG
jgi:hypothetical protein